MTPLVRCDEVKGPLERSAVIAESQCSGHRRLAMVGGKSCLVSRHRKLDLILELRDG